MRRKSTFVFNKKYRPAEPGKTLTELKVGLIEKFRKTCTINTIVHYLQLLDIITTFSPVLANELVQEGVIELLYKLLGSFNRNVPDQKAKFLAYSVLVNLTKITITSDAVLEVCMESHFKLNQMS